VNDHLKLIGATEEELRHPDVQAILTEMEAGNATAAAKTIIESVPPPPADQIPLATQQLGLEQFGLKLRKKTNIHDLFLQRVFGFGPRPSEKWIRAFQADPKNAGKDVPERIIPETYIPSTFIFIQAAPFELIEEVLAEAEDGGGFYPFITRVDAWLADKLPTDKTHEVWLAIQRSLAYLEKLNDDGGAQPVPNSLANAPTLKKSAPPGSSPTTHS
jgi:hypothetical protein